MRRQDEATRVPTDGQPEADAFDATLEEASSASHSRVHPSLVALARALGRGAAEADIARQRQMLPGDRS